MMAGGSGGKGEGGTEDEEDEGEARGLLDPPVGLDDRVVEVVLQAPRRADHLRGGGG